MKRVRFAAMGVVGALLAMAITGCPRPASTFQVVFPANSQDFEIEDSTDHLVMTVRFNQDVDMNTLIPGTNVILETETDSNADITVSLGANAREVVVESDAPYGELLDFNPDGFFTLCLHGSGGNPVRSTAGAALDGDNSGTAGGEYEHEYTLLG